VRSFDTELRELAMELELPEPVRSRVLLELRADLEAMTAALREEGFGQEEARDRAIGALLPSKDAVAELEHVHRPLYRRLVDRFSDAGRHRLERGLLAALVVAQGGGGLAALASFDLLRSPSPFLWPVLGLAILIMVVGVGKLFQLFVAGSHGMPRLRRGLPLLLFLAVTVLVSGFGGLVTDFYLVTGRVSANVGRTGVELLEWLRRDAAVLAVALFAAWAAGMFWLVAELRIARIAQTEAAALGLSSIERRTS
jgi:hypothetical protein